ncbi:hypothetical protein H8356DRAFT_1426458 [Neocallimastix lanati (nom. inval.)]|nr:hypothetical protein H8356DRAFT_1426458 [Neocallimastix sp. JGI-2020a]
MINSIYRNDFGIVYGDTDGDIGTPDKDKTIDKNKTIDKSKTIDENNINKKDKNIDKNKTFDKNNINIEEDKNINKNKNNNNKKKKKKKRIKYFFNDKIKKNNNTSSFWSEALDYPYRDWNVETKCTKAQGYLSCTEDQTYLTDKDGDYRIENGDWCLINKRICI